MYDYGNQFALGNNGGREPAYKSDSEGVEEFRAKTEEFFIKCQGEPGPLEKIVNAIGQVEMIQTWIVDAAMPTLTGLALALGFSGRKSMYDYEAKKEFSYIIKRAKTVIEYYHENQCGTRDKPTGNIFILKNMGWSDRTEVEQTTTGGLNITVQSKEQEEKLKNL
jgi:hypothetical protein